jgi:hypothetical protein
MLTYARYSQWPRWGTGWTERRIFCSEWVVALEALFDRIGRLLRELDLHDIREIEPYTVGRVEPRLGEYDAKALRIYSATSAVYIVPIARFAARHSGLARIRVARRDVFPWGDLAGGRVDISNGKKRRLLLRSIQDGQEYWYLFNPYRYRIWPLTRESLEVTLREFL